MIRLGQRRDENKAGCRRKALWIMDVRIGDKQNSESDRKNGKNKENRRRRYTMSGRKAQTIEKLADGILSLSIALSALTAIKVLPTISESFQIWCILLFNSAIGLGWLLGSARMWKKVVAVLLLLLCVLGLLVNRAFLF